MQETKYQVTGRVGRVKVVNPEQLSNENIVIFEVSDSVHRDTDASDSCQFVHKEKFAAYGYR